MAKNHKPPPRKPLLAISELVPLVKDLPLSDLRRIASDHGQDYKQLLEAVKAEQSK